MHLYLHHPSHGDGTREPGEDGRQFRDISGKNPAETSDTLRNHSPRLRKEKCAPRPPISPFSAIHHRPRGVNDGVWNNHAAGNAARPSAACRIPNLACRIPTCSRRPPALSLCGSDLFSAACYLLAAESRPGRSPCHFQNVWTWRSVLGGIRRNLGPHAREVGGILFP